jgi:hypothetical protein
LIPREDILGRHLGLAFTTGKQLPQSDVGVRDAMLPGAQDFQLVALLQDGAVVGGDVEEGRYDELVRGAGSSQARAHLDFVPVAQDGPRGLKGETVNSATLAKERID